MKVHYFEDFEYWYDPSLKLWVGILVKDGFQVSDCIYAANKDLLLKYYEMENK
jgi:hypothetical protein